MGSPNQTEPEPPICCIAIRDERKRPILIRVVDGTGVEKWLQFAYLSNLCRDKHTWTLKNFVYDTEYGGYPPGRKLREGPWVKVGSHDHPFSNGRVDLWLSLSDGVHQIIDI